MARGDGELLSGLGNLIGAVTGTIEKKNDQEFQLRREDTLTRLQTERDNMLMQTQAMLGEREALRNRQLDLQTQAAAIGVRVNKLHETGAVGTVINMAGRSLQENIDSLDNQASLFMGNIEEYNAAIGGFVEGSKGFAIATKKWEGLFQGDGVITDEEGRQLYREVYGTDPDDPDEQYRFQGFIQTARNKELYDRARLTESDLQSKEMARRESEANLKKAEYELEHVLPLQQKQLMASIANANMNTMNAAIQVSTSLRTQAETQAATVMDRILPSDLVNRVQTLLTQEGVSPEQAQTNVDALLRKEFFDPKGQYYNGTQTAINMSADQRLISEMLNGDDFDKFLSSVQRRQGLSVSQKAQVEDARRKGDKSDFTIYNSVDFVSDMFSADNPDGLNSDGGAAMKKLAMSYLHWKNTGQISTNVVNLTRTYENYVGSVSGKIMDEMLSGLRKVSTTPTALVQYVEGFTRQMHDTKTGANYMGKAVDLLYDQYTRRVMEVNIQERNNIPVLSKQQFSQRFDAHRAFGNLPANKQTVDPTATSFMNLLATSGLIGSVDMANPGYSEAAANLYTILELGGNIQMASADPSVLYEIANTTGEIGLQQLRTQSAFVADGIPRTSFFESFQRLIRATSSMNENPVRTSSPDTQTLMIDSRQKTDDRLRNWESRSFNW